MAENKDDLSGAFYVVQGAIFSCNQGALPCQIVVQKNEQVMIQGKPAVTTEETMFQIPTAPFGQCAMNPNTQAPLCEYMGGSWDVAKCYGKFVLEESKMKCSKYGGEIECVYHGQKQIVTVSDFSDFEEETAVITNSLFSMDGKSQKQIDKKKPQFGVQSIKAYAFSKELVPQKGTIYVRANTQIELKAFSSKKEIEVDKPVSWALMKKKSREVFDKKKKTRKPKEEIESLHLFCMVGPSYSLVMKKTGTYVIEGLGNSNQFRTLNKYRALSERVKSGECGVTETPPYDKSCSLKIEVQEDNKMISLSSPENRENLVIVGKPITVTVNMRYPLDEDRDLLRYSIFVVGEETMQDVTEHLSCNLSGNAMTFTPLNSETVYQVEFYLHKKNGTHVSEKPIQTKQVKFLGVSDIVSVVYQEKSNQSLLRVDSSLTFKVKFNDAQLQANYDEGIVDEDSASPSKVNMENALWSVKKDGKVFLSNVRGAFLVETFKEEGQYEVSVDLRGTHVRSKDAKCVVVIVANEVTKMTVDAVSGLYFSGVKYAYTSMYKYGDYSPYRDGFSRYELLNIDKDIFVQERKIRFNHEGKAEIKVWLGEKGPYVKSFDVQTPEVQYWEFCDSQRRPITHLAFKKSFLIHLSVPAWAQNEDADGKIMLSLWLHNKTCWKSDRFVKLSVKELSDFLRPDENGELFVEVTEESDLWEALKPDEESKFFKDEIYSGKYADLYFCLSHPISETIVGLRPLEGERKGYFFSGRGRYLRVTNEVNVSGYFSDFRGRPLYDIQLYGKQIPIQLFLNNVSEEQRKRLTVHLYSNDQQGEDDPEMVFDNKTWKLGQPDESGCSTVYVTVNLPDPTISVTRPRLFYFRVYDGDKCLYVYPPSPLDVYDEEFAGKESLILKDADLIRKSRSYLKQLKLVSERNSDLAQTLEAVAPVVVGEKIVRPQALSRDARIKCPRCHESAEEMQVRLKKIFPKASSKNVEIVAQTYTKYMRRMHMDTCWVKAHFFAQISVESGTDLVPKAEAGLYSRDRLEAVKQKKIFEKRITKISANGSKVTDSENSVYKSGMKKRLDDIYNMSDNSKKKEAIYNFMYSEELDNGNFESGDGYRYRGGAYVQITGKCNYRMVQRLLNVFYDKEVDIMSSGCDSFVNDIELATIASMCYVLGKYANQYALCNGKGESDDVNKYCEKVMGNDVEIVTKDGKTTNYALKARRFKENMSVHFELDKCEWEASQTSGFWTDPVKNPQACYFSQNGYVMPKNAVFLDKGSGGSRTHQGLDIFAEEGTIVRACLDGVVHRVIRCEKYSEKLDYVETDALQYVVIKLNSESLDLFRNRRREYVPIYKGEIEEGPLFSKDSDKIYFVYMHMRQIFVRKNQKVFSGQPIGTSGRTGITYKDVGNGTSGPHVHFEIHSDDAYAKRSEYTNVLSYRCNPSFYVYCKQYNVLNEKEIRKYNPDGTELIINNKDYYSDEDLSIQYVRKLKGNIPQQGKIENFEDE